MHNYLDPAKDKDLYVALKLEKEKILGMVKSINSNEIVFQFAVDTEIKLNFVEYIDIFKSGKIYMKDLPVVIISSNKFYDEQSFTKMVTGEIKALYNDPELYDILKKDFISI